MYKLGKLNIHSSDNIPYQKYHTHERNLFLTSLPPYQKQGIKKESSQYFKEQLTTNLIKLSCFLFNIIQKSLHHLKII